MEDPEKEAGAVFAEVKGRQITCSLWGDWEEKWRDGTSEKWVEVCPSRSLVPAGQRSFPLGRGLGVASANKVGCVQTSQL